VKQADPAPKHVPEAVPVHTLADENEEEMMSVNEMKGKRKSTGSIPAPKKQRLDHVVRPAHKFTPKDYKIFGTTKLADKSDKKQKHKQNKQRNKSAPGAPAPSYFTEPNFGKVKQTSKMARNKTDSFTYQKE